MAKTYAFRFVARRAEFYPGGVSVAYGMGGGATLANEQQEMTLQQALSYLEQFSAAVPAPHAASLEMARRADRCPPGFNKAETTVYRKS